MTLDAALEKVARHINWYTEPVRLLADVDRFLCQVMARGSVEDIVATLHRYSWEDFKRAYRRAPAGLFTNRAWAYWGLMLLNDPRRPMPERFPGAGLFDWRHST